MFVLRFSTLVSSNPKHHWIIVLLSSSDFEDSDDDLVVVNRSHSTAHPIAATVSRPTGRRCLFGRVVHTDAAFSTTIDLPATV
jgi:hypothetical protein